MSVWRIPSIAVLILVACLGGALRAQTPNAVRRTAAFSPALASSIAQQLSQLGMVNLALRVHDAAARQDWVVNKTTEASHINIDEYGCRLNYHWKLISDGKVEQDLDISLPLGDVEKIEIMPVEEEIRQNDAKEGHTARSYVTEPPVRSLKLTRSVASNVFNFYDAAAAARTRVLLEQAVAGCGGSRQGPALAQQRAPQTTPVAAASVAAPAPTIIPPVAASQDPSTIWVPGQGSRIALVIGNSGYGATTGDNIWPDLAGGPLHDADAVASRLRQLGFTVTETRDRDLDQMNADLRQLAGAVTNSTLVLFYYSGHGTRAPRGNGEGGDDNYLVPVRSRLVYDYDAETRAVSLAKIRNLVQRARAGVVIVDACRNDSLHRPQTRDAQSVGFAGAENVTGLLFAYSTAAGEVAGNRPGQTSLYTDALVRRLGRPGETLTSTFRSVRLQLASSGQRRLPELADALNQDIVLVP
jgi:hypothetical protein